MDPFFPIGAFQRRLSRLYSDTKKSSDFVNQKDVATAITQDPDKKAHHRKLKIQKDRLVSWGLEWAETGGEIDDALSKAGVSELVGSVMSTIKDTLAEVEPLWLSSKRAGEGTSRDGKGVSWDRGRFEDLLRDLTTSIDTLYDLSRMRAMGRVTASTPKGGRTAEEQRAFEPSRMLTPKVVDKNDLVCLAAVETQAAKKLREVVTMSKTAWVEMQKTGREYSVLLLEYAQFDPIFASAGINPPMQRFEKLSAGLQQTTHRSAEQWTGLPRLTGYFEDFESARIGLVYQFPLNFGVMSVDGRGARMRTLGELLARANFEPRLESKFRLAHNLANTVFDLHNRGIAHGTLSDENVSFGGRANSIEQLDIRRPLLSSFNLFPGNEDKSPAALLFRHPLDPCTTPASPLANAGDPRVLDLFSLGAVLLEIGLWTRLDVLAPSQEVLMRPEGLWEQLAIRCGSLYMKAARACWEAVDEQLMGRRVGEELLEGVQARVGRYLEACCIIDGVSGMEDRFGADEVPPPVPRKDERTEERKGKEKQNEKEKEREVERDIKRAFAVPEVKTEARDPIETIRPEKAKLRLYPHVALPAEAIEKWNNTAMPQINTALRSFYRRHPESVEISLESIGSSPQYARPTVLVVCTSVAKVKSILRKKVGWLFEGSNAFGLKVCSGQVVRSRNQAERGARRSTAEGDDEDVVPMNGAFQDVPKNGASIGAWIGDRHLPPVSFGGLVVVDDRVYGMTVHHMLDDPDGPQEGVTKSCAWGDEYAHSVDSSSAGYSCEFSDGQSDVDSDTDVTSEYSSDEDDGDYNEPGDIPGVEPGCGDGYIVTQPAKDDMRRQDEDFYPDSETEDEDHLSSCSIGDVYASSGIRRRTQDGLVHEVDWALFEFRDRTPAENMFPGARAEQVLCADVVGTRELPNLKVRCVARTSGCQEGVIMPTMTSVKIFGRVSPSHAYQVYTTGAGGGAASTEEAGQTTPLGLPGDSGAWIVCRDRGSVCGHVLAFSHRKRVAYMCPMDVLLSDIREVLGTDRVRLPGKGEVSAVRKEEEDLGSLVGESEGEEGEDEGVSMEGEKREEPVLVNMSEKGAEAVQVERRMRAMTLERGERERRVVE